MYMYVSMKHVSLATRWHGYISLTSQEIGQPVHTTPGNVNVVYFELLCHIGSRLLLDNYDHMKVQGSVDGNCVPVFIQSSVF